MARFEIVENAYDDYMVDAPRYRPNYNNRIVVADSFRVQYMEYVGGRVEFLKEDEIIETLFYMPRAIRRLENDSDEA